MMHFIRLQYGLSVEAPTSAEAYRKLQEVIKQNPAIAIRGEETKEKRSLVNKLIFGY